MISVPDLCVTVSRNLPTVILSLELSPKTRAMARPHCLWLLLFFLMTRFLAAQEPAESEAKLVWPPQETLTPFLLHEDPYLPIPGIGREYNSAILPLLEEALGTDNNDLQRDAATSITLLHQGGYLDCSSTKEALAKVLLSEGRSRLVLKDVATALVTIDAREAADVLFAAIGRDPDLVRIIEPALARWNYRPAQDAWRQRLEMADDEASFLVHSAIRGAGLSRDQKSVPLLQEIVLHSPKATCRLAAAEALGSVSETGLEKLANQILQERSDDLSPSSGSRTMLHRLMVAKLLRNHRSDEARQVLLKLAADFEGTVASVAWGALVRSAPRELRSLTQQSASAKEALVRGFVVETLVATPDSAAVEQLGLALSDRHPDVRNSAREALLSISEMPELRDDVIAAGEAALHRDQWEGLEQSAVLLGALDYEPAADRCFELLTHPRAETAIAAAWALRKFSIPETLPRMLKFCEELDELLVAGRPCAASAPIVVSHLFEAMGQMVYDPAEALLRRYIPKQGPRLLTPMRQSAVAALGWLKAGSEDEDLCQLFYQRLIDESPLPISELEMVRYASVVSIGRIKASSFESKLRAQYPGVSAGQLSYSIEWALTQFTGKPLGKAATLSKGISLLPLKPVGFRHESVTSESDSTDAP